MTTRQTLERIARNANIPEMEIQELLREWENDHNAATTLRKYIEPGTSNLLLPLPIEAIYSEKFAVDTASLTLQISSSFQHLMVIGSGRTTTTGSTAENIYLQLNADTAANYDIETMYRLDNVAGGNQNLAMTALPDDRMLTSE